MKALLFFTVFISGISFAQTNVIAAKSHSNFDFSFTNEPDNFGEYILPREIKEVAYVKDDCIVEKYTSQWNENDVEYDTICNHPFLQQGSFDIDRIKAMYPEETKFKNFDKAEKAYNKSLKKQHKAQQQNQQNSTGLIFFLLIIGGFLLYLFIPRSNRAKA